MNILHPLPLPSSSMACPSSEVYCYPCPPLFEFNVDEGALEYGSDGEVPSLVSHPPSTVSSSYSNGQMSNHGQHALPSIPFIAARNDVDLLISTNAISPSSSLYPPLPSHYPSPAAYPLPHSQFPSIMPAPTPPNYLSPPSSHSFTPSLPYPSAYSYLPFTIPPAIDTTLNDSLQPMPSPTYPYVPLHPSMAWADAVPNGSHQELYLKGKYSGNTIADNTLQSAAIQNDLHQQPVNTQPAMYLHPSTQQSHHPRHAVSAMAGDNDIIHHHGRYQHLPNLQQAYGEHTAHSIHALSFSDEIPQSSSSHSSIPPLEPTSYHISPGQSPLHESIASDTGESLTDNDHLHLHGHRSDAASPPIANSENGHDEELNKSWGFDETDENDDQSENFAHNNRTLETELGELSWNQDFLNLLESPLNPTQMNDAVSALSGNWRNFDIETLAQLSTLAPSLLPFTHYSVRSTMHEEMKLGYSHYHKALSILIKQECPQSEPTEEGVSSMSRLHRDAIAKALGVEGELILTPAAKAAAARRANQGKRPDTSHLPKPERIDYDNFTKLMKKANKRNASVLSDEHTIDNIISGSKVIQLTHSYRQLIRSQLAQPEPKKRKTKREVLDNIHKQIPELGKVPPPTPKITARKPGKDFWKNL